VILFHNIHAASEELRNFGLHRMEFFWGDRLLDDEYFCPCLPNELGTNSDCQVLPVRIASADMEIKIEKFPATILKSRLTNSEEKLKKYSGKIFRRICE
jgi:hypothetical protein